MIRTFLLLSLLTFVFLLTPFHTAQAEGGQFCEWLFEAPPIKDRPTVEIAKVVKRGNESFYRLRLLPGETSWRSLYAQRDFDPQGDPRWPLFFLGEDLGQVFGFDGSGRDFYAPTPETLNARIEAFNRYLKKRRIEPIPIRFYLQPRPKIEGFLRNWYRHTALPVAAGNDTHTMHDISFHFSSVLLPIQIVRLLQIEAGMAWEWLQRVNTALGAPVVVRESVMVMDTLSTVTNYVTGFNTPDVLAEQMSPYLHDVSATKIDFISADDVSNPNAADVSARWRQFAASHTPLDLFRRKLMNRHIRPSSVLTPHQELMFHRKLRLPQLEAERMFLLDMAFEHPEWADTTLKNMGLGDFKAIEALLNARAAELRTAARDYLKEMKKRSK